MGAVELPKRRQIRLKEYDYSAPGAYFVTICTQNRRHILSNIAVGADALGGPILQLSEIGKIVEKYILSSERMGGVHIDKYVIMPNHIHLIVVIDDNGGSSRAPTPTNSTLANTVGALKRLVNREIGQQLWQRGYYEHIIRGEDDYREIWRYIDENPAKWTEDEYYAF